VQIVALRPEADEFHRLRVGVSMRSRVDPQGNWVRACSACPGDYEDPEPTAWNDPSVEDAGEAEAENAEQPEARE